MIPALLLLSFAPQLTTIPLEPNGAKDDRPYYPGASFTPSGGTWLLPHSSGSIVEFDMTSLTGSNSIPFNDYVYKSAVSPDGTRVVLMEPFGRISIHSYPGLTPLVAVNLIQGVTNQLVFNQANTRIYADGTEGRVYVIDSGTGDILRTFHTGSALGQYSYLGSGLASNDQTWITAGTWRIKAFDTTTGQLETSIPFGPDRTALQIAINPARTQAHVLVRNSSAAVATLEVDLWDLGPLNRISTVQTSIPANSLSSGALFRTDSSSTRAIIGGKENAFLVELPTGATTVLPTLRGVGASLTTDGQTAAVITRTKLDLYDANTGLLQTSRLLRVRESYGTLTRHPQRPLFIVSYGSGYDRLDVVERTAPGQFSFADVNPGLGAEVDGLGEIVELNDGRTAAVLHGGSDHVAIVDVDVEAVLARISVERDPVAMAELGTGELAIAHDRGQSVVFVDPLTFTTTGRVSLPGRSTAIEAVPGTSLCWVQVLDVGQRSLELVDGLTTSIMASIPLPAPVTLSSPHPDIVFDFVNDHAIVVDAGAGTMTVVELSTQTIVGVGTFTSGLSARIFPTHDGLRFTATSSNAEVTSWLLTPAGLIQDWRYNCTANPVGAQSSADAQLSSDGGRLIAMMPQSHSAPQTGQCPAAVILDLTTGQDFPGEGFSNGAPVKNTNERFTESTGYISAWRFDGTGFVRSPFILTDHNYRRGNFVRGVGSGRTLATAYDGSAPQGFENVLVISDPLHGLRQVACSPAEPNFTGSPASLDLEGTGLVSGRLNVRVTGLEPNGMFGFLLVADTLTARMPAVGSQGFLCLGGNMGRYVSQVQRADASGQQRYLIDLDAIPLSAGTAAAQPGETWAFQSWYRDQTPAGLPTSNFSPAVAVQIL